MNAFNSLLLAAGGFLGSSLGAVAASGQDLTPQQIRERFVVTAEVFVFDASGKKLLAKMPETSVIKAALGSTSGPLVDRWASRTGLFEGLLAMKASWDIGADGAIKVTLTEYVSDSEKAKDGENRYARELKTEERTLDFMGPVNWVSLNNHAGKKVIVRYTPNLRDNAANDVTAVKIISEKTAVVDSKGVVWADHLSLEGKYVGLTTHRGTLLLSYYPFKGAKFMGVAQGNRMEVALDNKVVVSLISQSNYLVGSGSAKVYGIYQPERKSKDFSDNHITASNQEGEFLKKY